MTHDIRKALIERMKAVLPYAENEARGLAAHEDCEQEAAEAWQLIEQAQAAIGQTEAEIAHATRAPQPLPIKYDDTLLPFLALMRKELHANAGKGDREGWLAMTPGECLLEIYYHQGKLQKAVKDHDRFGIREFAADVANMAMMLVDICALLTCSVKGCRNLQPDDVRYSGMCADCYQKDCEEGQAQALEMAANMAKYGTIDVPKEPLMCIGDLCCEEGISLPAVRMMPQSTDQGVTVEMVPVCQNHAVGWWDAADWDGRHLERELIQGDGGPAAQPSDKPLWTGPYNLCQDEGCPHHGTEHTCDTPVPRLAPERYREVQAGNATLTDEERAAGWFFDDEYDGLLANRAWPGHEGH